MSRVAAIETSLVLVAIGTIIAVTADSATAGLSVQLIGLLVVGAGTWGLMLSLLVGTRATTAIGTTSVDRDQLRRPRDPRREPIPVIVRKHVDTAGTNRAARRG
jgi:hypothetical protein